MNQRFAFFALSFAITLLLLQTITGLQSAALAAIVVTTGIALFLLLKKKKTQAAFLISGTIFAILLFFIYPLFDTVPEVSYKQTDFNATVVGYSYDNHTQKGIVCDVEVTALENEPLKDSFTARMYFNDTGLTLTPGSEISGVALFELPENTRDFKSFTYFKTRGIEAIAFCEQPLTKHDLGEITLKYVPQWIAHNISVKLAELLPSRVAGLISAILIGDKTDFATKDRESFTAVGLAHVVAVSGMHLSFLSGFIIFFLGRRKTAVLIIPILILFTLVVGAPPSVVRALIMQIILIMAPILRGEADSINSLSVALVLILLFNPYAVMDVGLQLSFLSTLGIITLGSRANNIIKSKVSIKNKLLRYVVNFSISTLCISISAIIFTTPITVWNFHTISVVAPITNLLLLWIINFIFIVSLIVVAIAFVYMPIAKIIMMLIAFISELVLDAAVFIAEIPFANISIDRMFQVIVLVYLYFVLFVFVKDKKKRFGIPVACVSTVLVISILVSFIPCRKEEYAGIRFSVLDVAQGSAMLADYNGAAVLVDCGGSRTKSAGDIANEYLTEIGEDSLDALIITHFDSDHMNGAKRLIEKTKVSELYVPVGAKNEERANALLESAQKHGTKIYKVSEKTFVSKDGLDFTIYPTGWFSDSNENGLVIIFDKDDFELVITGDLSRKSEKILGEKYNLPDAEAYIVGHHGSKSSSSIELMNEIRPEFAVISVGADNNYKHPHQETLSLLENMGITVRRTDINGNIVFYSDELLKGAA